MRHSFSLVFSIASKTPIKPMQNPTKEHLWDFLLLYCQKAAVLYQFGKAAKNVRCFENNFGTAKAIKKWGRLFTFDQLQHAETAFLERHPEDSKTRPKKTFELIFASSVVIKSNSSFYKNNGVV